MIGWCALGAVVGLVYVGWLCVLWCVVVCVVRCLFFGLDVLCDVWYRCFGWCSRGVRCYWVGGRVVILVFCVHGDRCLFRVACLVVLVCLVYEGCGYLLFVVVG